MTRELEIRWHLRDSADNPDVSVTTLQWRYRAGPDGEGWWTDWQDVPTQDDRVFSSKSDK